VQPLILNPAFLSQATHTKNIKHMKTFLILITAGLLASCTTSNFTPYEGAQNWPVSQGALVDRKYAVPVYYGPPPQPYIVMGLLQLGNATAGTEVGAAANKAKEMGADAIILISHGTSQTGTITNAYVAGNTVQAYSIPIIAGAANVAIIRWAAPRSSQPQSSRTVPMSPEEQARLQASVKQWQPTACVKDANLPMDTVRLEPGAESKIRPGYFFTSPPAKRPDYVPILYIPAKVLRNDGKFLGWQYFAPAQLKYLHEQPNAVSGL